MYSSAAMRSQWTVDSSYCKKEKLNFHQNYKKQIWIPSVELSICVERSEQWESLAALVGLLNLLALVVPTASIVSFELCPDLKNFWCFHLERKYFKFNFCHLKWRLNTKLPYKVIRTSMARWFHANFTFFLRSFVIILCDNIFNKFCCLLFTNDLTAFWFWQQRF